MLVGLTDPFSAEAAKAQYPDSGAGRSLCFQQRFASAVSTDVNGTFAFAVNPKINYQYLGAASSAGTTITWNANWQNNVSTNLVNTYGRTYRPTSFGVRYTNTLSATASSGYIVVAKAGNPTVSSTTTFAPNNFTGWDSHPNSHGGEWHASGHPKTSNAYDMVENGTYTSPTDNGNPHWETIYVAGFGLPASVSVGFLEFYVNHEYCPFEDAPIAALATKQPVLNVAMQTAVNSVQSAHPTSHKGSVNVISGFVKREAKKALVKHVIPFVAKKAVAALV